MRAFSFTLVILAMVLLLSSALPLEKDKDGGTGLLELENPQGREKFLQRRKPPAKVPGPKFGGDDEEESAPEEEDGKKSKKGKKASGLRSAHPMRRYDLEALDHDSSKSKDKEKGKHLVSTGMDYAYLNEEETQQEIGNLLRSQ